MMTRRDDEHAWLLETATRLREIGMDEAAEFLDEMGKADQLELSSRLSTIHEHLLKLAHASEHERQRNRRLWRVSVATARNAAQRLLKRNPSLRPTPRRLHWQRTIKREQPRGRIRLTIRPEACTQRGPSEAATGLYHTCSRSPHMPNRNDPYRGATFAKPLRFE
jgi:hypothetical protein